MTPNDDYSDWLQARRSTAVPADFVERTMLAVRASVRPRPARTRSRWLSTLALAAGVLLVMAGHAATIGTFLCALEGVAQ